MPVMNETKMSKFKIKNVTTINDLMQQQYTTFMSIKAEATKF